MIRNGFTLIEVIIVIVILGVLAGLALPKIAGNIEAARAAEAMHYFGVVRRAVADCVSVTGGDAEPCDEAAEISVAIPVDASFDYYSDKVAVGLQIAAFRPSQQGICMELTIGVAADGTGEVTDVQFSATANGPFVGAVRKTGSSGAAPCIWGSREHNLN